MEHKKRENSKSSAIESDDDARFQSTIQFPYADLSTGIEVVQVIHSKAGGVSCTPDQLAAAMGQTPRSGNFRLKISTARIFGLIATSPGKIEITDLGFEIIDATREKAACVQAFMNVELFRKVYEDFRGKNLPPRPAAFELMLQRLGVSPKQKGNARRALDNSAQQAGFYEHGKERLVTPNLGSLKPFPDAKQHSEEESDRERRDNGGGKNRKGGGGDDNSRHPFIQGLLRALPEPETNWTIEGRAKWLQAAANIFDLMYKGNGEITIQVKDQSELNETHNEEKNS
jgi:hypothetical protein